MSDERKPPPRFRRPSELLDDEVVEIPPAGVSARHAPPRPLEPFAKIAQTQGDKLDRVLETQRKMALQMDGFGQAMNRRFDIFHEELAMLRSTVLADHGPRIGKVEKTLGQKAAKGGSIVALVLVVAPMLADALPKYRGVFDAIAGLFQ